MPSGCERIAWENNNRWKKTSKKMPSVVSDEKKGDRCYDLEMFSVARGRARLHYQSELPADSSLIAINLTIITSGRLEKLLFFC